MDESPRIGARAQSEWGHTQGRSVGGARPGSGAIARHERTKYVFSLGCTSSARRLYGVYHGMAQRVVQCVDRRRTSAVLKATCWGDRSGDVRFKGDGQSDGAK